LKLTKIDNAREFEWSKTTDDYSTYRTEYPQSLFNILTASGVGLPGQRILDLGTGTGALAIGLARQGAEVTGLDISASQISAAKKLAQQQCLQIKFVAAAAEDMNFDSSSFEVVTAAQAWIYFDTAVVLPKILRLLNHDGCLVLTHVQWLPHKDEIARETERLILKYNPGWTGAGYKGDIRPMFNSVKGDFDLKTFHVMNELIEFTRDSWRGRIRACRATGATLNPTDLAHFDEDHAQVLEQIAPEKFGILHQLAVHILVRKGVVVDV
jgi:2-polyprenyl-3-methyl-5-hydroxy-6-metoxy-1,4-benzoquinol methylase